MDDRRRKLLERLERFEIGDPAASLSFARRLARDNGWTLNFAHRVIAEYKRFVFLMMEAGHPVTPSDEVDQAWHLHLVYTESYWHDLCRDLLGRPLHHGPTRGGRSEGSKFSDWYARTLASYERFFGHAPPPDIWPDAARRFGRAPHFRRVNAAESWVIPKSSVRSAATLAAIGVASVGLVGCGISIAAIQPINVEVIIGIAVFVGFVVFFLVKIKRDRIKNDREPRRNSSGCGTSGCGAGVMVGSHGGAAASHTPGAPHHGKHDPHHGNQGDVGVPGDTGGHSGCGGGGTGGESGGGSGCGGGGSGCGGGGCGGGGD